MNVSKVFLTLQDNGGDSLTITANGPFTFKTAVTGPTDAYAVTVLTQLCAQKQQQSGVAADQLDQWQPGFHVQESGLQRHRVYDHNRNTAERSGANLYVYD
jgi:hypothetical protein